jgi:hypothetical protein
MICAHTTAPFVREFDLFRTRVGLPNAAETYTPKAASELHENAARLRLGRDDGRPGNPPNRDH